MKALKLLEIHVSADGIVRSDVAHDTEGVTLARIVVGRLDWAEDLERLLGKAGWDEIRVRVIGAEIFADIVRRVAGRGAVTLQ